MTGQRAPHSLATVSHTQPSSRGFLCANHHPEKLNVKKPEGRVLGQMVSAWSPRHRAN